MILHGKTVLITGAAKRVGAAVAENLAAAGCRIIIHCHNSRTEAETLLRKLPGSGHRIISADLSDENCVLRLAQAAAPFDLLVNSAALFFRPGSPDDLRAARENLYHRVNFRAPELLLRFFFDQKLPSAAAVNISDAATFDPIPSPGAYLQSKIDLNHLTLRLAPLWAEHDYRINAIAPGPMLPPPWAPDSKMTTVLKSTPFHRPVPLSDLSDLVNFQLSCSSLSGTITPLGHFSFLAGKEK